MASTEMSKELSAKFDAAVSALIADTDAARQSDNFKAWLRSMAVFHTYSYCNQILIWAARPDAIRVAGYQAWKKLGRCVNKGEKAIYILAPLIGTKENALGEEVSCVRGFRAVPVFDIAQTSGETLPDIDIIGTDQTITGAFLYAMERAVSTSKIELAYVHGIDAYGLSYGGKIEVSAKLDDAGRARTLAHEFAHEVLAHAARRGETTQQQRELEAEAVAYVVMTHFGYTMPAGTYLASYKITAEMLMASLQVISKAAKTIIDALDKEMEPA